jgi:hypothetical protein
MIMTAVVALVESSCCSAAGFHLEEAATKSPFTLIAWPVQRCGALTELNLVRWFGSIATETSFSCHVGFAPVSDEIADIA